MSEAVKKVPKKLRGKDEIMVDTQILRWRRRMERNGQTIGSHTAKAKERREYYKQYRETATESKLRAKKFFE